MDIFKGRTSRAVFAFSAGIVLLFAVLSQLGIATVTNPKTIEAAPAGTLTVNVFQDTNANAIFDAADTIGLIGVTVSLFDEDDLAAGACATADTGADGQVVFLPTATATCTGSLVRMEVDTDDYPAGYLTGPVNQIDDDANGATPAYADDPADASPVIQVFDLNTDTVLNISAISPANYQCGEADAYSFIPCYVNGDPLIPGVAADLDAFVGFPYLATGAAFDPNPLDVPGIPTTTNVVPADHLATAGDIGSTWGVAWSQQSQTAYLGALVKRHVGLGPLGLDGIYSVDLSNGPASPIISDWVELEDGLGIDVGQSQVQSNAARGLLTATTPTHDVSVFDLIGTIGIGDVEIVDDELLDPAGSQNDGWVDHEYLFVTDLQNKNVLVIDTSDGSLVSTYDIPAPDVACTNGEHRPWALKYADGSLYVGLVCDASIEPTNLLTTGVNSNLEAIVYEYDLTNDLMTTTPPAIGTAVPQTVLRESLDYDRGAIWEIGECPVNSNWHPWLDLANPHPSFTLRDKGRICWPTPILADIEFSDQGNMLVSFIDRTSHQWGFDNWGIDTTDDSTLYQQMSGGDILMACLVGDDYVFENNGQCGGLVTNNPDATAEGPGGLEFFYGESASGHHETANSGMAVLPGSDEVMVAGMNPWESEFHSTGGVNWFGTSDGTPRSPGYILYASENSPSPVNQIGTQGKAGGLGDLEVFCPALPQQIGNYAWFDENGNGVFDADETGLEDSTVYLQLPDSTIISTTTDANGYYSFDIDARTTYTVAVDVSTSTTILPGGSTVDELSPTEPDSPDGTELSDSDLSPTETLTIGGIDLPVVILVTGNPGDSSSDESAGFVLAYDLALVQTLADGQEPFVSLNDDVEYKIVVKNQGGLASGPFTVTEQIPAGMSFVSIDSDDIADWSTTAVASDTGAITIGYTGDLAADEMTMITLTLSVDSEAEAPYRSWAEISDDSSEDYGTTDEDSTPDTDTGIDDGAGLGTPPTGELVDNHNDIDLDNPADDEDDNDYEDVDLAEYDLALIQTLADGQDPIVALGDDVEYKIIVQNQGDLLSGAFTVTEQIPAGMSFVSIDSDDIADWSTTAVASDTGAITIAYTGDLATDEMTMITLTLSVDSADEAPYRSWAEISEDSGDDDDSTPDTDTGIDDGAGLGTPPTGELVDNHNDIDLDDPADDEDDNDYEDVELAEYDLALIQTLANGQEPVVSLGEDVEYKIIVQNQGDLPSGAFTVTEQIPAGMSFVSIDSDDIADWSTTAVASDTGAITITFDGDLLTDEMTMITLTLSVDSEDEAPYRSWAEISEDSGEDDDSTPDTNTGIDDGAGLGSDPDDDVDNHNDIDLDDPADDEDDNDYEDVDLAEYDLALIQTLADGQDPVVALDEDVEYKIIVQNQGDLPSGSFTVTEQIPAGMSFVSIDSDDIVDWSTTAVASDTGTITIVFDGDLLADEMTMITLTLSVDSVDEAPYRSWAEISEDSGDDDDSTPDTDTGIDDGAGLGSDPDDDVDNHNDIDLDNPDNDEDDNDYEDVDLVPGYDLALIHTLAAGQDPLVELDDEVEYKIIVDNQGSLPSGAFTVTEQIPGGMSFVSIDSDDIADWSTTAVASDTGAITIVFNGDLLADEMTMITLTLSVDSVDEAPYRSWAEISEDSGDDEDSTPDTDTGIDDGAGLGSDPDDDVDNHNNIDLDNPDNDEDDNDYEDVDLAAPAEYDLALIQRLDSAQSADVDLDDVVHYEILVANQGTVDSGTFTVTEEIPAGMSFAGIDGEDWTTDATPGTTGTIELVYIGDLAPEEITALQLDLQVDSVVETPFRAWAEISDDSAEDLGLTDEDSTPDSDTGIDDGAGFGTAPDDDVDNHNDITLDDPINDEDDNDFEDVEATVEYDLALIKTLAPGQSALVETGPNVNFVITVRNQGNVPSNDFVVTDQIPAGMSLVAAAGDGFVCPAVGGATGTIACSYAGSLAPNAEATIALALQIDDVANTPFRNWAEISVDSAVDYGTADEDSTPDADTGNDDGPGTGTIDPDDDVVNHNDVEEDEPADDEDDNDYEQVDVDVEYDLALIIAVDPAQDPSVQVGEEVEYDIVVKNQGNVGSGTFTVTQQIPSGMSFVGIDGEDWTTTATNGVTGTVTLVYTGDLDPDEVATLDLILQVDDATDAPFRTWAEISDDSSEEYGVTDEDSVPDTNTGSDDGAGTGTPPDDDFINHDNIDIDDLVDDEDDNDFADIIIGDVYDLALIHTLADEQPAKVDVGDLVDLKIKVANQGNVSSGAFTVTEEIPAGMSFVSIDSDDIADWSTTAAVSDTGTITIVYAGDLDPDGMTMITLTLSVDSADEAPYRSWAEISEDSAVDYGTNDEDSTPDTDTGIDDGAGFGTAPDDDVDNHNDITLDDPADDEDDNDYEDIELGDEYDLALIQKLDSGQSPDVELDEVVDYEILVQNQGDVNSGVFTVTEEIPAGMSFVGISGDDDWTTDATPGTTGTIEIVYTGDLEPDEITALQLALQVDSVAETPFRAWAEISDDSADLIGETDVDSTPDSDTGSDTGAGTGIDPNDDVSNHNDVTLDDSADDEDDNDYEDVTATVEYDLALIKTLAVGQSPLVTPTAIVDFVITVRNQGNVESNDFVVTDQIPAGMELVSAAGAGFTCPTPAGATGPIGCFYTGSLAPNDEATIQLSLLITDSTATPFRNWAEISLDSAVDYGTNDEDSTPDLDTGDDDGAGTGLDPNDDVSNHNDIEEDEPADDEDDNDYEQVDVDVEYDLALIVTLDLAQSESVQVGEEVDFDIVVKNQGNVGSGTFTVTEQIPSGMSFVGIDGDDWTTTATAGVTETITLVYTGDLDPDEVTTLDLVLQVDDDTDAPFRNWAEISDDSAEDYGAGVTDEDSTADTDTGVDDGAGTGTDPNDDVVDHDNIDLDEPVGDEDDNDYADTVIGAVYDLALVHTLADGQPDLVSEGDPVEFKIKVANQGNVGSGAFTVTEQIPAGMSFVSIDSEDIADWSTTAVVSDTGTITIVYAGDLDPDGMTMITLTLQADSAEDGPFRSWAEISDDSSEDYGTTDEDSTPDDDTGSDDGPGLGDPPNDDVDNHNDLTLDDPADDEDDNDYEDVEIGIPVSYDLALIQQLEGIQLPNVELDEIVDYEILVQNQGIEDSGTFTVTEEIPGGMSFAGIEGEDWTTDAEIGDTGTIEIVYNGNLESGETAVLLLDLKVDSVEESPFRAWAEISDDSAEEYGEDVTDEDSTPDTDTGSDPGAGVGTDPNDDVDNHNDVTLDNPAGDEDDNDYEDVEAVIEYDLALIQTLAPGQDGLVEEGDDVAFKIIVANQGNVSSESFEVTEEIPAGMSFVSISGPDAPLWTTTATAGITGTIEFTYSGDLEPEEMTMVVLTLAVDDAADTPFRSWAEISEDSSDAYGATDEDSTPDADTGEDTGAGTGDDPNDDYSNHNDISLDDPADDEDDNDYEQVDTDIEYDLALIVTLDPEQDESVQLGDEVTLNVVAKNQGNVGSGTFTVTNEIPSGMSFVGIDGDDADDWTVVATPGMTGTITLVYTGDLDPDEVTTVDLILQVDDVTDAPFRNWAEISDDSAEEYGPGVTDEDSTADGDTGIDDGAGTGTDPNDDVESHNNIDLDDPAGDEDDNDFVDILFGDVYDLALIHTLATGQAGSVAVGEEVEFKIKVANQGNVGSGDFTVTEQIPAGMSFVSIDSEDIADWSTTAVLSDTGTITIVYAGDLGPDGMTMITLTLSVDSADDAPFRSWAEISDDSAEDYGVTDEDSTPDADTGDDMGPGFGLAPNDEVDNHNDLTLDDPADDEDDNDYEDVDLLIGYDLALIIKLAPDQAEEVMLGETVEFEVVVRNQGDMNSGTFTVTQEIPAGMSFAGISGSGWTTTAVMSDTGTIELVYTGDLEPNSETAVVVELQVDSVEEAPYRVWAEISEDSGDDEDSTGDTDTGQDVGAGTGTDPNDDVVNYDDVTLDNPIDDEDDNDYADVRAIVSYDLALIKTLAVGQSPLVTPTETVDFVITVRNQGNVPSNDFVVTDQIPAGMSLVSASGTGFDCPAIADATGAITCSYAGSLAPGAEATIELALLITDATQTPFRNWAEISEDSAVDYGPTVTDEDSTPDSNVGNDDRDGVGSDPNDDVANHNDIEEDEPADDEDDNDFEQVDVNIEYDLALIITLDPAQNESVVVGEEVDYDILVKNQGNVGSGTFTVTEQIPAGMSFVSIGGADAADWTTTAVVSDTGTITLVYIGDLEPGEITELDLVLLVDDDTDAPFRNWAEISDDSSEEVGVGVTDDDSIPDTDTGNDDGAGTGTPPNDPVDNHDNIHLDDPADDEDDNDFADVMIGEVYDLALIQTLSAGQADTVGLNDPVSFDIIVGNQGNVDSGTFTVTQQIPAGMSFVSIGGADAADWTTTAVVSDTGTITLVYTGDLAPDETTTVELTLQVDDIAQTPFRSWSEISDDSSEDYGTTDEDSTPDTDTGNDDGVGTGIAPNDDVDNHDDITLDDPAGDEDDNDYADVAAVVNYDLALINTLAPGQSDNVDLNDDVVYLIEVKNQGDVDSGTFTVADMIPGGMSFRDLAGTDWSSTAVPGDTGEVTLSFAGDLAPGESTVLTLTLRVDEWENGPFRNWAEITEDSAADYGTTDSDSTPDDNNGSDPDAGDGGLGDDPVIDHDDIDHAGAAYDDPAEDEDDSDYEDITTPELTSIGNLVFHDTNNNGLFDPTDPDNPETGIDGVTVQLFDSTDTLIDSVVTQGGGLYLFENLPPGQYQIKIPTPPPAFPVSSQATNLTDSRIDNDDNGSQVGSGDPVVSPLITLSVGDEPTNDGDGDNRTDLTIDFGFYDPLTDPTAVTLISFSGSRNGKTATLRWETGSEIDNFGFFLVRTTTPDMPVNPDLGEALGPILTKVDGGTGTGSTYSFDDTVDEYGTYWYWLVDVETDGDVNIEERPVKITFSRFETLYLPMVNTD
ncbi:MAG: SdrD B-like domain-containing protein [Anaerolineae bacterium]